MTSLRLVLSIAFGACLIACDEEAQVAETITPADDAAHVIAKAPQSVSTAVFDGAQSFFTSDSETRTYETGSVGKLACTYAVLDAVAGGELSLDDPVAELIEGYTGDDRVTLRHLLQNRSGLPDTLMEAFRSDPTIATTALTADEAASRFASGELAFEPGERFDYIHANWIAVSAVLAEHHDKPTAEVVGDVFARAGMADSFILPAEALPDTHVMPEESGWPIPGFMICSGGMAATPTDVIRLLRYPYAAEWPQTVLDELEAISTLEEGYTLGGRYRRAKTPGSETYMVSWQNGTNASYHTVAAYDTVRDKGFAAMTATEDKAVLEDLREAWFSSLD